MHYNKIVYCRKAELMLDGIVAGSVIAPTVKEARSQAYDAALKRLNRDCYVIKVKKQNTTFFHM